MIFWCIHRYRFCHFWNDEVREIYELRNEWSELRILGSDEDCPLIFDDFLIVIVNVTWILVPIVIMADLNLESKSLVFVEIGSHHLL